MTDSPFRSGFVAVVGRPNVGKSSLMNAYLGEKIAIVSPKPQTTRQTQLGILSTPAYQVVFVDTPGIHEPRNALGQFMVTTAVRAMETADALLFIVDVSVPPTSEDERCAGHIRSHSDRPAILALNKSDLLKPEAVLSNTEAYRALVPQAQWMLVSATRGDNLDQLREMIVAALPEGPPLYAEDELTQTHVRDIAAELIREAALHTLEQEVPYGIAVEIETFDESRPDLVRISARIIVERESHKPIVIGRGGAKLKEIGTRARLEIERLLGQKVFLELHVKVRKDWRANEREVKRLGYKE